MVFKTDVLSERANTGLYWSKAPKSPPSPKNPYLSLRLDTLDIAPLEPKDRQFILGHWAVTEEKADKLPDIFQDFMMRDTVVSERFAAMIEDLEPGLHELFPIPRVWSFPSRMPVEAPLFFLNIHTTARTVDLERSKVRSSRRGLDARPYKQLMGMTEKTCVATDPKNYQGLHMWRDDETRAVFMSQDLVERIKRDSLVGFYFTEAGGPSF